MATFGPVWIVAPGAPDGEFGDLVPTHPIVLPPDLPPNGDEHPEHPIVIPPDLVDPDWGISIERPDNTLPGDLPKPDQGLPGDQPHPEHPIAGTGERPDHTLPGDLPRPDQGLPEPQPHPEHPIVIPPTDPARPAHPIYLPVFPDNSLPTGEGEGDVGDLDFYQRKTIGINWDASLLAPAVVVAIYVMEDDDSPFKVRTVPNDGSSSVTFPQDFTGERTFRVASPDGSYCDGTVKVT